MIKTKVRTPDFDAVQNRFFEEEKKLEEYRDQCEREVIELTLKWKHSLEIWANTNALI